jgi:hypothetical protein
MQSVTIRRGFRRTKNGCHFAAIVEKGGLRFLDQHPQTSYEGRRNGLETYSLAVPKGTLWLEFIKDNGTEMVLVRKAGKGTPIQGFSSFKLARAWMEQRLPFRPATVNPMAAASGLCPAESGPLPSSLRLCGEAWTPDTRCILTP